MMTIVFNSIRTGVVTLAAVGMLAPQASIAGNKASLGGNSGASHVSSSIVGHVATGTTTNKSNTPSNVGSAPKLNVMSNVTASQLLTKVVGKVESNSAVVVGPAPHTILHP